MSNKKINTILFISFFSSGISGLIYEVVWAKYLSIIFGNTTYAHTLVLATFMGGLAVGSFILGRLADRSKDLLNFYIGVQISIALFSILTPNLFAFSKNIYLIAAKNLFLGSCGIVIMKFFIGALIILPPTILMGGTLPILGKFMVHVFSERGKIIASLYYINNFGAVLGTLLAGFYLIYRFGLDLSITIAAIINLLAAVTVVVIRALSDKALSETPARTEAEPAIEETPGAGKESAYSEKIVNFSLFAILLSGFAAMLYEISWIRMLSTILGSSTYSFSLMLTAFICGITIGSFLVSRFMPKDKFTFLYFGFCEALIAISLILAIPLYERLPYLFFKLSGIFSRKEGTFLLYETTKLCLSFLVMLPPTILLGATLPLISEFASGKLQTLGKKVGGVFGYNMIGNILGALITGLILLPLFGLKGTLEFGLAINLTIASLVFLIDRTLQKRRKTVLVCACCLVFIVYKQITPNWNKANFTAEVFRYRHFPKNNENFSNFSKLIQDRKILFYKDGPDATICVAKFSDNSLSLFVNGKADASTGADMPTQILVGQIPLILKPLADNVLVVGLGSGVTCGSVLLHPLQNLDVVEISRTVEEASRYFNDFNYNLLRNNKLHLYIEDAKTFIQRSTKKYDVIISEPSNPWMSGIGGIFSKEFFTDCFLHLKDDGIMVQWVQIYEMDNETFKIIARTFCSIFPEVTAWQVFGTQDILLMGSKKKIAPDFIESEKRLAQKTIKEDLSRIKLYDIFTLLSLQLATNENIRNLVGDKGPVNSDYHPVLEYKAPLALYAKSNASDFLSKIDERRCTLENSKLLIKDYLRHHTIDRDNLKNLYLHMGETDNNLLLPLVKKWYESYPEDRLASLAYFSLDAARMEKSIVELEKLIQKEIIPEYLDIYASLGIKKFLTFRSFFAPEIFSDVIKQLKQCVNLSENNKGKFYFFLGDAFLENMDFKNAIGYYAKAEELLRPKDDSEPHKPAYMQLLSNMYFAYLNDGQLGKAFEYARKIQQ